MGARQKLDHLLKQLREAQEHVEGPYYDVALEELRTLAQNEPDWEKRGWIKVAALAGQCAIDGEFKICSGDRSGWVALERSRRYWAWLFTEYPGKFYVSRCAVALVESLTVGDRDGSVALGTLLSRALRAEAPGEGLMVDSDLRGRGFARFCLRLSARFHGAPEEESGDADWDAVFEAWDNADAFADAMVALCEQHLLLSNDEELCVFYRGQRLYAPEIRALVSLRSKEGRPVDSRLHPLLALEFLPSCGSAEERDDPVLQLLNSKRKS